MAPYIAAVVSAVLMWASFPPLGWGLLAFVAPTPLLLAIRRVERGGAALAVGFLFGLVFFGGLLIWILILGAVAWIPLTVWLATTAALLALVIWLFRLWPPTRWWLITIGVWSLWEFVRATFPLGGFPWGSLGYAAAGNPGALGAVQWIGPTGWTALAIATAAGLALLLEDSKNWRYFVDPLVVALMLALAGGLFPPRAEGDGLRVAIVQGNSPCPGTRCQNENQRIYQSHLELTQSLPAGGVDLVVWPENSTGPPYDPETNEEVRDQIGAEAMRLNAYLLISGTRSAGETEFINVNEMYAPSGNRIGEYFKRHPVPFGEYVPLRGLFDFIPQLERVPRDMVRGEGPVVFETAFGTIGSVISFEGAFSRLVRSEAQEGAELMVVATNEASFGDGAASDQLIGYTRVNAAAIGQDLVHAAITGKSTFISASGEVRETSDLFTTDVLIDRVAFRTAGPTVFSRFGDWVLLVALAGAVAAIAVPGGDRPPTRRSQAGP